LEAPPALTTLATQVGVALLRHGRRVLSVVRRFDDGKFVDGCGMTEHFRTVCHQDSATEKVANPGPNGVALLRTS
jgi:hypothetical protein